MPAEGRRSEGGMVCGGTEAGLSGPAAGRCDPQAGAGTPGQPYPAGGGKGTGISKMLEYYGIDRSQAMAFGDGNNDIEMFQAVDMGVAMENASDDLKAVAADTCDHVAEDGVYRYCVKHSLI